MFLASGMKFRYVILITLFLFVGGIVGILSEPYRIKRVASFLFPNLDPSGINYQVINSKNAIISGGLFGKGFGQGYYKNGILPEVQNDFIIANIGEETGLIGLIFVFCLFGIFAFIAYKASQEVFETVKFLAYSAFGFTTTIIWQAIANIAVGLGLVPPTGIVLPFFSQGGTNLFIVIIESCLIYRVIKKSFINESPKQQEDFNYIGFDANNIFDKEE